MAHLGPRHPPGARRAGLRAAGFAPRARRSISISTCPSAAPARMAANSFGAPWARQRSTALHPTALLVEHREARSMTLITRLPPGRAGRRPSAARPSPAPPPAAPRPPGAVPPGGASNRSAARPAADPRHRPPGSDADAGRASSSSGCARDAQPLAVRARRKIQIRPVLDAHRVLAAHPLSVRARWGARMFPGVTAEDTGWSMSRSRTRWR